MAESKKKILFIHNFYLIPGGEDQSHRSEIELFKRHGHSIFTYEDNNTRIEEIGKFKTALKTIWSHETYKNIRRLIQEHSIDLIICQNIFPLISPSLYYAAKKERTPVFQFVRNYRLLCLNALFYRNGGVCEECLGKRFLWPGIIHKCYRGNFWGSIVVALMNYIHWRFNTWNKQVTKFICLNQFSKGKLVEGGIWEQKISIRPNFLLRDSGVGTNRDTYLLYVGRLSEEKGIKFLLDCIERNNLQIPLKIVGSGPLNDFVISITKKNDYVKYLGSVTPDEVLELMRNAFSVIVPSTCYEVMPRTIIESFGTGTPVIGSNIGGIGEMVEHKQTGLLFIPGNADDLANCVHWAYSHPDDMKKFGENARLEFLTKYTAEKSYLNVLNILLRE